MWRVHLAASVVMSGSRLPCTFAPSPWQLFRPAMYLSHYPFLPLGPWFTNLSFTFACFCSDLLLLSHLLPTPPRKMEPYETLDSFFLLHLSLHTKFVVGAGLFT